MKYIAECHFPRTFYYSESRPLKRSAINFFTLRLFAVFLCVMIAAAIYLNLCTSSCHAIAKRSWSKSHKPNVVYSFHLSAPIFLPLTPRLSNFFFTSAFQSKVFSSLFKIENYYTKYIFYWGQFKLCNFSVESEREGERRRDVLKSISSYQFISIKICFRRKITKKTQKHKNLLFWIKSQLVSEAVNIFISSKIFLSLFNLINL